MANEKVSYAPTQQTTREEKGKVYNWETNSWDNTSKQVPVKSVQVADNSQGMSEEEITDEANDILGGTGGKTSNTSKSKKKATQENDSKEFRTLQGSLKLRVNTKTIKLRVGETVRLIGLGKYLSGLYYITEISRTLDSSGYSQSITVIKTNFTKTLKEQQVEVVKGNAIQR